MTQVVTTDYLKGIATETHQRSMELLAGLDAEQVMGPRLVIVNPLRWEIAHVAWFWEKFILRDLYGYQPLYPPGDQMYDSIAIAHETRWDLPLLEIEPMLDYVREVQALCLDRLESGLASEVDSHIYQFATFHQDMHNEAYTYTRQTLAYPQPDFSCTARPPDAGPLSGDVNIPGGEFQLGSSREDPFIFDNEKWVHPIKLEPFRIARAPVTQGEFAEFVDAGGYQNPDYWDEAGWQWRQQTGAEAPVYWRWAADGCWQFRRFDQWQPLPEHQAMIHVNWHEANAWCRWANRRLPSEAEWEAAALAEPNSDGSALASGKRRYPWGDEAPMADRANFDGYALGCLDVAALPAGDSAFGCRQMLGNVWEWTADVFKPYPGFAPDAYKDYSQPVFNQTRVLKGGGWATRGRMVTGRHRNFFTPDRRDVMAGFRTCAG